MGMLIEQMYNYIPFFKIIFTLLTHYRLKVRNNNINASEKYANFTHYGRN